MGAFLFYLLKSGCCLVIFYIFFKLMMSRSTFFRFNRITLLVGLSGCTLLPLIELTTTEETFLHTPLYAIHEILQSTEQVMSNPEEPGNEILLSEKNTEISSNFGDYIWSRNFVDICLVVCIYLPFGSVNSHVREKTVWKLYIGDSPAADCFV